MAFSTEVYNIRGMKQDMSDLLAEKEFAFENKNIRLLVDDTSTNLVIVQEQGNKRMTINLTSDFFLDFHTIESWDTRDDLPFVVIGHCEIDKYLVVFGKNEEYNHDYIVRFELVGQNLYGWVIYNGNELHFDISHPLETIGNIETNLIKKVYFVDGVNVPRVVNVVLPNAGDLANINLGYHLRLEDVLNVEKTSSQIGNYPMGKVRFFYTYSNDLNSESNIVDWSPFFDCNFTNQGGGPDSQYKTQFAFRVNINNLDTQFKFIRIYVQHFTSADPNNYTLKVCERNIQGLTDFSEVVTWDEFDALDSTITYLDKKLSAYTFIPYTFAEKNNRLFYGNIKKSLPSVKDINLQNAVTIKFGQKKIGTEDLTTDYVYQYESDKTTFAGSNFDYMGFRKGNWYRFGLIAQYQTGEWSDVMFIGDAQCTKTSKTEVSYNANHVPQKSDYYIPYAFLMTKSSFNDCLQQLYDLGYRRIKPVCVVPPPQYRTIITQGISCSTLYNGGSRLSYTPNKSLFAIPSFFFRPTPLFNTYKTIKKDAAFVFDPGYSFTIRKLTDLKLDGNIKTSDGDYLLNPRFDADTDSNGDTLIHYSDNFREYRHGMSLPPKDVIQAELQSSDFSLNDYYYKTNNGQIWNLLNSDNMNGVDLYYSNKDNDLFRKISDNDDPEIRYGRMPAHSLITTGYNNTVFVDESLLTLNSPEIDYNFSDQVEPFYLNQYIDIVGYAQVTGSQMDVDIPQTTFQQEAGAMYIDNDALYNVAGKCLFNLDSTILGDTNDVILNIKSKNRWYSNVIPLTSGPWWFDTMLVNSFKRYENDSYLGYDMLGPASVNLDTSDFILDSDLVLIDRSFVWRRQHHDPDIKSGTATTTFFGETNKHLKKDNENLPVENLNASVFYVYFKENNDKKIGFALFTDDYFEQLTPGNNPLANSLHTAKQMLPITFSTLRINDESSNLSDAFWTNYFANREIPVAQYLNTLNTEPDIAVYYFGTSTYHFYATVNLLPWLLPHADLLGNGFIMDSMNGSMFGCHYYMSYSTNFIGSVFEPIYPHTIYPFMTTTSAGGETPFCGSSDIYRKNKGKVHPSYNKTSSFLYSNCTNYVSYDVRTKLLNTVSAYYCSPNITQEHRPEPDLTNVPFLDKSKTPYWYSFKYNNSSTANVPTLLHRTYTLTPAMKWYRGFKNWGADENLTIGGSSLHKVSNGNYLTKSAIVGNLFFSGTFPQFVVKRGTLSSNYHHIDSGAVVVHTDSYQTQYQYLNSEQGSKLKPLFDNKQIQTINLDYNILPHIVYYTYTSSDVLRLLPHIQLESTDSSLLNKNPNFEPKFYYKEFIPNYVTSGTPWTVSAYPHTGHFEQLDFDYLVKSNQPRWNADGWLSNYPNTVSQTIIKIDDDDSKYVKYDANGNTRYIRQYDLSNRFHTQGNIWTLPISNMYNTLNIQNPYIRESLSCEVWNWKMCGPTINIKWFLDSLDRKLQIRFEEGDTYFQRYNCFKTASKDLQLAASATTTENVDTLYNNVTESASVMIESYYNLDGLYWEHNTLLLNNGSNPMLTPLYNKQKEINPVYSIQNDLCDTFKQVDYAYFNAELNHYPTEILWSLQKTEGETLDSWGVVPMTNAILTSGEMGEINKLISYNDNVYCLQEHGLSVLNYDPHVVQPTNTDSTLSVYLTDATKLQGVTYLSRSIGTLNKWSVVLGHNGFYWMDETMKKIYKYGANENNNLGIIDLSLTAGFDSWCKDNIDRSYGVWNPSMFYSNRPSTAFKGNYDLRFGDIYWSNNKQCLCYNENLQAFVSFYSYEHTPYKFTYLDNCFSILNNKLGASIWHDQVTYDHCIYTEPFNAYVELLANPMGLYDKVFNFIEYNLDVYKPVPEYRDHWKFAERYNSYNYISVSNVYQEGEEEMNLKNTRDRFRTWRTSLPRQRGTINRIRSPWCKIKLEMKPDLLHPAIGEPLKEYKDKLYYIGVNFTSPEQPLRTNIQQ